jgi:hypothetical protein
MAPKAAQTKLDKQIEQLGELRNAGTRAVEFREWRQTTLTLIERIWPDQATRATRFRRIPFSPASANADDKVMREAFERGCAEARRLLKLWLAEVGSRGVSQEAEAPRLAEAVRQTMVEMQPQRPASLPSPPPPPAAASRPRPEGKPVPKPSRRARKEPLGEMLGFQRQPGAVAPELPQEFDHAAGDEQRADALAQSIDHALERARREVTGMRTPGEPIDPRGRSYSQAPVGENRTLVSYVARAFIALSGDLEELGVPEGQCEMVRLALFDLAHHLDCGSVTWVLMRDAVTLVMHYPALGRQALPLLLPYLESAA